MTDTISVLIKNTVPLAQLFPAFPANNIPVAVSVNDQYMPILGVMLHSLVENTDENKNYDVLIMCNRGKIREENIKRMSLMAKNHSNIKIRYVDLFDFIKNLRFFTSGNYSIEVYFRLFLPQLLPDYDKILYLDADMVICRDVSELYDIEIGDTLLGATKDAIIAGSIKSQIWNMRDYLDRLGIQNPHNYFQSGVLILNLKELRAGNLYQEMIEYALTHKCDLVDQDVLNFFCQNRVTFIDGRWNVDVNTMALDVVKDAPSDVYELYLRNLENAYIYHFAGVEKPWINPSLEFAHIFWRIARKTPFYEMMMVEIIRNNIQSLPPLNSTISEEMILIMMNKNAVYIQYYKYKLLSKITLGEKRRRYKEKRKYFHEKVRQIRLYFKLYINANSR